MVFLIIEIHSWSCSSVITKGGARRIILPWVGFANNPFSFKAIHKSQAVELSGVSLMRMALSNHLPLTAVIKLVSEMISLIFERKISPIF